MQTQVKIESTTDLEQVTEEGEESFPASDPPAWTGMHAGPPVTIQLPDTPPDLRLSAADLGEIDRGRPAVRFAPAPERDAAFLSLAEALRTRAFSAGALDTAAAHLVAFAVLVAGRSEAARPHALAALDAGASLDQLHQALAIAAVVDGGRGAYDRGGEILTEMAAREGSVEERDRRVGPRLSSGDEQAPRETRLLRPGRVTVA